MFRNTGMPATLTSLFVGIFFACLFVYLIPVPRQADDTIQPIRAMVSLALPLGLPDPRPSLFLLHGQGPSARAQHVELESEAMGTSHLTADQSSCFSKHGIGSLNVDINICWAKKTIDRLESFTETTICKLALTLSLPSSKVHSPNLLKEKFMSKVVRIGFIAAEHRRCSETNLVKWIEIQSMEVGILVMWQVMANCNADRKWVWFTQTAVRARCFCCQRARLPNSTLLAQLAHHSPGPRIVLQLGPLHSRVLFPRLFPAVLSVGYPGLASCVMRRSTSLLLENY